MYVLREGPAYYDTFSGLVPVRVEFIEKDEHGPYVHFVVTRDHGPYRRGYRHGARPWHVCPRNAIRRRKYSTVILPYTTELSAQ